MTTKPQEGVWLRREPRLQFTKEEREIPPWKSPSAKWIGRRTGRMRPR